MKKYMSLAIIGIVALVLIGALSFFFLSQKTGQMEDQEVITSVTLGSEESTTSLDQAAPEVYTTLTVETNKNSGSFGGGETFYLNATEDLQGTVRKQLEQMVKAEGGWTLAVQGSGIQSVQNDPAQTERLLVRVPVEAPVEK